MMKELNAINLAKEDTLRGPSSKHDAHAVEQLLLSEEILILG